jgi:hypothetical protein
MLRHSGHEITLLLAPDPGPCGGGGRTRPSPPFTEKGDQLVTGLTKAHLAELHKLAGAPNELLPDQRA